MDKVYLDHSATTRTDEDVARLMVEYMTDLYGNPSSVHSFGRVTRKAVEEARERSPGLLGLSLMRLFLRAAARKRTTLPFAGWLMPIKKEVTISLPLR